MSALIPFRTVLTVTACESAPNAPAIYLARLAPSGRRTMLQALATSADWLAGQSTDFLLFPWHQLRYLHMQALRNQVAAVYAVSTANKHLAAVRGVLKECWKLEQISSEDYHRAILVEPVRGESVPAGRAILPGELRALFNVCQEGVKGLRDAALLSLLYQGGLRRTEATTIARADYPYKGVKGALLVHGKGGKQRVVYLEGNGEAILDQWLVLRGEETGPLLCSLRWDGQLRKQSALSTSNIHLILQDRARQAGVTDVSAHDFRRTCISDLLDAGVDLYTVQQVAGHASPRTTSRYDRRGERTKQEASAKLHVPMPAFNR